MNHEKSIAPSYRNKTIKEDYFMRKRKLLLLLLAFVTSYSANAENDDLLRPATNFSGYIFSDFNSGSGNSQRGLAVGGNLEIGGYSIGAGLPPDYGLYSLGVYFCVNIIS
ncbi:collagen-binding domain-containing protein [Salinivibrio sp. SS3]|uniref:collagen-binding domain-containing protein n=1 Tax=Salinivibrio sp. SS3 TaxID=1895021 RepID=UPI00114CDF9F|nr:collagen-binding domain-containing protein [Salinivibrio sp. BNH]